MSFLNVKCVKCKASQNIFDKASTVVKCSGCNEELAKPTGGKAIINGKILNKLD